MLSNVAKIYVGGVATPNTPNVILIALTIMKDLLYKRTISDFLLIISKYGGSAIFQSHCPHMHKYTRVECFHLSYHVPETFSSDFVQILN